MDPLPTPTTSRTILPRSRAVSLAASSRSRSRASSRSGPPIPSVSPEPEQARAPTKRQPTKRRRKDVSNTTPRKRRRKETVKEGETETQPSGVVVEELSTGPLVSPDVEQKPVTGPPELTAETTAEEKHEPQPEPEPLSSYNCPICFTPPTNATLTPCGHICCGSCLFTAVKVAKRRAGLMMGGGELLAKCPVCRATIPGWDGRGGGVIGLKTRTLFSVE
ncbi:hypothetical protein F5146DRAFT_1101407 [Armillaria mellea]|nr:hypothetical protein F5146DRAFT_1101407 [Armillaria mellea]